MCCMIVQHGAPIQAVNNAKQIRRLQATFLASLGRPPQQPYAHVENTKLRTQRDPATCVQQTDNHSFTAQKLDQACACACRRHRSSLLSLRYCCCSCTAGIRSSLLLLWVWDW